MVLPAIADTFRRVPEELVGLCRPHGWDELTRPPTAGMRSVRDILIHLIDCEGAWVRIGIEGETWESPRPTAFADLEQILASWALLRQATLRLFQRLTPAEALALRSIPWQGGQQAAVGEIVWHVVTHEQYHRGQIFTRLALLGRRDLPDQDMLRR